MTIKKKEKILLAFIPVLHKGYIDLFTKYPNKLYIFGQSIINEYVFLTRDLRTINPILLKQAIEGMGIFKEVVVLEKSNLSEIKNEALIMPDEVVSHDFASKKLNAKNVTFEKVFLRWDRFISKNDDVIPEGRLRVKDKKSRDMIKKAFVEAEKSSDWWRRIGAVLTKKGKVVLVSHNRHLPTDYHMHQNGDPRSNFNAGERIDIYTSIHGEADIIAKAARQGISLEGTEVYVTTFPCSNCARLIGESGIKKVFYSKGYSRLDSEDVLKAYDVEIYLVE
ncbi:MAG: dCMP deaminase [Patescibacteria group bacterium]|nr:dCMP deaminase [Patescibacteria group bacterium]